MVANGFNGLKRVIVHVFYYADRRNSIIWKNYGWCTNREYCGESLMNYQKFAPVYDQWWINNSTRMDCSSFFFA